MINLSKASKMPAKSWSLQAGSTCPGSIDPFTKQPLPVCAGCYAKGGTYNFPNSKKVRDAARKMVETMGSNNPDIVKAVCVEK